MKKLILFVFLAGLTVQGFSQKIYFAYLQSEAGQPFFVRMNDKVFSSSSSGYLILSRLHDSTYNIYLGFPGQSTEQKFSIPINHKDKGYLLKDFGAQGWGLFDMQALTVQMAQNSSSGAKTVPDDNVSPFTEILSKAADDPSLKEKSVAEVTKKNDPVIPAVQKQEEAPPPVTKMEIKEPVAEKTESSNTSQPVVEKEKETASTEEPKKEPVKTEPPVKEPVQTEDNTKEPAKSSETTEKTANKNQATSSEIVRLSESAGKEGHDVVYVDNDGQGKSDTIRLQIPNTKIAEKPVEDSKPAEKKFLDIPVDPTKDNSQNSEVKTEPVKTVAEEKKVVTEPVKEEPVKKAAPAVTCTETASESDFLKTRRKMVATDDDDGMINEARKAFKGQCFTVYQIRNLGTLFLTDEGRYRFFDAAYPYASDPHNFVSLKLELKEGYWVKRFEAMLK
jgi:hypothetical protein